MGDVEQSATDFLQGADYPYLVALMAPRPALLTYNGEDDCCFRATWSSPGFMMRFSLSSVSTERRIVSLGTRIGIPATTIINWTIALPITRFFTKQFGLPPITTKTALQPR